MYIYIAYRDLKTHYTQNSLYGGVPYNNDYKFTAIKDGLYYLLTLNGANYRVSKEAGEKFIEDVLNKCTGEHQGSFPFVRSLNGKDMAAVIERSREVDLRGRGHLTSQDFHYDMDADVLYQMLEELRAGSGEPMDKRALMNYCYPNPTLPEGDFDLTGIYHCIYCTPDNKPNSVIQTVFPDEKVSCFSISKNGAYIQMRVDDNKVMSNVPAELIPEIKEKVRELCKDPAEAYVEHGDWEGFIRFNNDEEISTDPDKTLELLNEIASKSEYDKTEAVDTKKYYTVGKRKTPPGGFEGFGMFGMMGGFPVAPSVSPADTPSASTEEPASDSKKCKFCGADVTHGTKFCSECGRKVE